MASQPANQAPTQGQPVLAGAAAAPGGDDQLKVQVDTLEETVKNIVNTLTSIPAIITTKSTEAADYLATKIDEYRKTMKGENQDNNSEMIMVKELHAKLLTELRSKNPSLYCTIVKIAYCYQSKIQPIPTSTDQVKYLKCPDPTLNFSCTSLMAPKLLILTINLLQLDKYIKKNKQNETGLQLTNEILQKIILLDVVANEEQIASTMNL